MCIALNVTLSSDDIMHGSQKLIIQTFVRPKVKLFIFSFMFQKHLSKPFSEWFFYSYNLPSCFSRQDTLDHIKETIMNSIGHNNQYYSSDKTVLADWSAEDSPQKMNECICLFFRFFAFKGKKQNTFLRSFFGRIYGAPICFWFYLTFSSYLVNLSPTLGP